nr:helix-turn-helix transcriptional regulator [uncultured Enterocloster sp.]
MSIGENIRYLRKQAKLTQKQLAQMVGVNEVTIRSYERGKYEPKTDVLYRLVKVLDCNINELLDKPIIPPDFLMDNFEKLEGTEGIMIKKNFPSEEKEEIKKLFLKPAQEIDKSVPKLSCKPVVQKQDIPTKYLNVSKVNKDSTHTIATNSDCTEALKEENDPFKKRLIEALAKMNEDELKVLEKLVTQLSKKEPGENP